MKVSVHELIGLPLAYAVALARGENVKDCLYDPIARQDFKSECRRPDRKWAHAGPIVRKHCIGFQKKSTGVYEAWSGTKREWAVWPAGAGYAEGPTQLIAAMRCFVADMLGGDVDIPKAFIGEQ